MENSTTRTHPLTLLPCYTPRTVTTGVCGLRFPGKTVSHGVCLNCPHNPGKIKPPPPAAPPAPRASKAVAAPPPPPYGLGTLVRNGIDATTLGTGKTLAQAIAKVMGKKNCACDARMRCLNALVPDVRVLSAADWATLFAVRIFKCLGAREAGAAG